MAVADTTRRRNLAWILAGLFAAAVLGIILVRSLTTEDVVVRVSPVTHENLLSSVSTNGKVEPVEQFQAHAPFPGVVQKVYVGVGQKVREGDLLIRLNDADARARVTQMTVGLLSARAVLKDLRRGGTKEEKIIFGSDLDRAQEQERIAQQNLASLRTLQTRGAASASEVEVAEQRLQGNQASVRTLQQRISGRFDEADLARQQAQVRDSEAGLAAAQSNLATVEIRAPFAGTVYSVPINTFDFVPSGEDILDLADLTRLQIRAYFDEPEIGKLSKGQAVKIVWDAKPNQTWHGHIDRAPTTVITYGTRNVGECLITVDDAKGDLLPNTNVTVTVTTSQRFNVLSVPREALHTEGATSFVYRVLNHRLVRTGVQIGAINLTRVEITGGLTEKDTVALGATSNRDLENGLKVSVVE